MLILNQQHDDYPGQIIGVLARVEVAEKWDTIPKLVHWSIQAERTDVQRERHVQEKMGEDCVVNVGGGGTIHVLAQS